MDLELLFHPRSVAVVGASPSFAGGKLPYYQIIKAGGYAGRLYPVNPKYAEVGGVKAYPSLAALPETVDVAVITAPAAATLELTRQAAALGVKYLHFFTSGFSEIGEAGREAALVAAARAGGTRIVGPNCLGVHCAASRFTFDPNVLPPEGHGVVGFLGQSGGVTENYIRVAHSRGIYLNKGVSYGNQIDLRVEHYLDYFADDPTIKVVAAYVEDIKDGPAFNAALEKLTAKKPLVALKGGSTAAGARAAQSHTGALAGSVELWSALLRQRRAVEVETPEQLVELVMIFAANRPPKGRKLGFLGAGGGTSVLFTDLAAKAGLEIPLLGPAAQRLIAEKIPAVNTSVKNPVDLGAFGFDAGIMSHTMRAMDPDPAIDVLVPYFAVDFISMFPDDLIEAGFKKLAAVAADLNKPIVPIVFKSSEDKPRYEQIRLTALRHFRAAGLPVFFTLNDAVHAIARSLRWSRGEG